MEDFETPDLFRINLDQIKNIYKRNNYLLYYKNSKLKLKLDNVGIYKIENNPYTNKIHVKFRIDDSQKNKLIEIEDKIFGNLGLKPFDCKSMIINNILNTKIIERYKKFEIDIFDEFNRLITISELKDETIADIVIELINVLKLYLNENLKYGIIVVVSKIALRRNN